MKRKKKRNTSAFDAVDGSSHRHANAMDVGVWEPLGLDIRDEVQADGCGGSGSFTATGFSKRNVSLAAGASCVESMTVHATATGALTNTTSTVTSNEAAPGGPATATLTSNPALATHFAVSAPSTATAGTAFSFTVTALARRTLP
jgi:hypothetical protein